jgi:hypothetical protein
MVINPDEMTSTDPDGFGCYSDHANDIQHKGACDMCGSTDESTVGHVLPETPRVAGLDPVEAAEFVTEHGLAFVDGVLLDFFSASAVLAVYKALGSDEARSLLRGMMLERAVTVSFKVIRNVQERGATDVDR